MRIGKGEGFILLSAAGFGIMPVLAKYAYGAGCSVSQVLLYRFVASSLILWCYVLISRKDCRSGRDNIIYMMLLGLLGYDITAVFAFTSFKHISAGLADLLLFLYPPIIVIIKRFFFKEHITRAGTAALVLSIVGICFIVYAPNMEYNATGITAGILSAVFYSFYVLALGAKRLRHLDGVVITTYVVTFCTIGILIYGILSRSPIEMPPPGGWVFILMLAVLSTVMPIFLFCIGVKEIGPSRASIISTVEPAFAVLAGAVLLGEGISVFTLIGGLLIVSGIILLQRNRRAAG